MLNLFFYINVVLIILLSIYIVFTKNGFHLLISFFLLVLNIALVYISLGSTFVALTYVLIYLSAVIILIIFNIMMEGKLINIANYSLNKSQYLKKTFSALIATVFFIIFSAINKAIILKKANNIKISTSEIKIEDIGLLLMTKHIIAFEVISLILIATLIGIIIKLN